MSTSAPASASTSTSTPAFCPLEECGICMLRGALRKFGPCGHAACGTCVPKLRGMGSATATCPWCRTGIFWVVFPGVAGEPDVATPFLPAANKTRDFAEALRGPCALANVELQLQVVRWLPPHEFLETHMDAWMLDLVRAHAFNATLLFTVFKMWERNWNFLDAGFRKRSVLPAVLAGLDHHMGEVEVVASGLSVLCNLTWNADQCGAFPIQVIFTAMGHFQDFERVQRVAIKLVIAIFASVHAKELLKADLVSRLFEVTERPVVATHSFVALVSALVSVLAPHHTAVARVLERLLRCVAAGDTRTGDIPRLLCKLFWLCAGTPGNAALFLEALPQLLAMVKVQVLTADTVAEFARGVHALAVASPGNVSALLPAVALLRARVLQHGAAHKQLRAAVLPCFIDVLGAGPEVASLEFAAALLLTAQEMVHAPSADYETTLVGLEVIAAALRRPDVRAAVATAAPLRAEDMPSHDTCWHEIAAILARFLQGGGLSSDVATACVRDLVWFVDHAKVAVHRELSTDDVVQEVLFAHMADADTVHECVAYFMKLSGEVDTHESVVTRVPAVRAALVAQAASANVVNVCACFLGDVARSKDASAAVAEAASELRAAFALHPGHRQVARHFADCVLSMAIERHHDGPVAPALFAMLTDLWAVLDRFVDDSDVLVDCLNPFLWLTDDVGVAEEVLAALPRFMAPMGKHASNRDVVVLTLGPLEHVVRVLVGKAASSADKVSALQALSEKLAVVVPAVREAMVTHLEEYSVVLRAVFMFSWMSCNEVEVKPLLSAVPEVLAVLERYPGDARIAFQCALVFHDLSSAESNWGRLDVVVPALLTAFNFHTANAQIVTMFTKAFWNLATTSNKNVSMSMVPKLLVALETHSANVAIVSHCVCAFRNLAFGTSGTSNHETLAALLPRLWAVVDPHVRDIKLLDGYLYFVINLKLHENDKTAVLRDMAPTLRALLVCHLGIETFARGYAYLTRFCPWPGAGDALEEVLARYPDSQKLVSVCGTCVVGLVADGAPEGPLLGVVATLLTRASVAGVDLLEGNQALLEAMLAREQRDHAEPPCKRQR